MDHFKKTVGTSVCLHHTLTLVYNALDRCECVELVVCVRLYILPVYCSSLIIDMFKDHIVMLCSHIFIMMVFYDEHHIPQFIYKAFIRVRYNICRTLISLYGTQ